MKLSGFFYHRPGAVVRAPEAREEEAGFFVVVAVGPPVCFGLRACTINND